jgi:hypothetical protein
MIEVSDHQAQRPLLRKLREDVEQRQRVGTSGNGDHYGIARSKEGALAKGAANAL